MDRYQRVEKPRPEEHISENEIRVTAQGLIRNYIIYATSLLQVLFLDHSVYGFIIFYVVPSFLICFLVGFEYLVSG